MRPRMLGASLWVDWCMGMGSSRDGASRVLLGHVAVAFADFAALDEVDIGCINRMLGADDDGQLDAWCECLGCLVPMTTRHTCAE